jgi:hypothetical protein
VVSLLAGLLPALRGMLAFTAIKDDYKRPIIQKVTLPPPSARILRADNFGPVWATFSIQFSMNGGECPLRGSRIELTTTTENLVVEPIGIEPTTSGLQSQRSPN